MTKIESLFVGHVRKQVIVMDHPDADCGTSLDPVIESCLQSRV